jgi:exosome complex component MTR3
MPNGETWLDPTASEAAAAKGTVTLACLPALNVVTSVWQKGTLSPQEIRQVSCACRGVTCLLHEFEVS